MAQLSQEERDVLRAAVQIHSVQHIGVEAGLVLPQIALQGSDVVLSLEHVREETSLDTGCDESLQLPTLPCQAQEASDLRLPLEPDAEVGATWKPGWNCVGWVGRGIAALQAQSQVLVVNVYLVLSEMPKDLLRQVLKCRVPPGSNLGATLAAKAASSLLRLPYRTIVQCLGNVKRNSWNPVPRSSLESEEPCEQTVERDPQHTLRILTRTALATGYHGRSHVDYVRDCMRLHLAGADIGQKYHSKEFAQIVERLGAECIQALDAEDIHGHLPALGIPSDLAIAWDGVSLGASSFSRHETLQVMAAAFVSPHSCRLHARFLAAPSSGGNHSGQAQVAIASLAMTQHPVRLDMVALRSRCALVCGDGQVVVGGEEARHHSSGAAERLWRQLHPDANMLCTEWDKFHREDIAGRRAVRASAAAQEVFDVADAMHTLFGIGQGRVLFRSVASHLATETRTVSQPSRMKKIGYISGIPGNLLVNYKAYYGGLHARMHLTREGRGSQTLTSLVAIGRRLSSLGFVAFAMLFHDVLRHHLRPFALLIQEQSIEPWVIEIALERFISGLGRCVVAAQESRRLLLVGALLAPYVTQAEWLNVLSAFWYSPAARCFPGFYTGLPRLLVQRTFAGCKLNVATEHNPVTHMVLSPRCQCASQQTKRQTRSCVCWRASDCTCAHRCCEPHRIPCFSSPQCTCGGLEPCWVANVRCRCWQQARCHCQGRRSQVTVSRRQHVQVPEWVAHCGAPLRSSDSWYAGRFLVLPKEQRPPAQLAGESRFRNHLPRCQIPHWLPNVSAEVDGALRSLEEFAQALVKEMGGYFGPVGISKPMADLLKAMRQCWDWGVLATSTPQAQHVQAFLHVFHALVPFLKHTAWPNLPRFADLQRNWNLSDAAVGMQYLRLLRSVRTAGQTTHRETWFPIARLKVLPVWPFPGIVAALLPKLRSSSRVAALGCFGLITVFLGEFDGNMQPLAAKAFFITATSVARVGYGAASRARRREGRVPAVVGVMGVINAKPWKNKLIHVIAVERKLDPSAVSASLDGEHAFAMGGCWHAVRLHHRCRCFGSVESCCERYGSLLHSLFDAGQHLSPGQLVARLHLREGQLCCLGSSRDEQIVQEIATVLGTIMRKCPFVQRGQKRDVDGRAMSRSATLIRTRAETALMDAGRVGTQDLDISSSLQDACRAVAAQLPRPSWANDVVHQPTQLESSVASALDMLAATGGEIKAMPMHVARGTSQDQARSVVRARLDAWMQSVEGREWQENRRALWGADGDED